MKLTQLEQKSLKMALEYAICDYETNLQFFIDNRQLYGCENSVNKSLNESDIKNARSELRGMQRAQDKLFREMK